MISISTDIYLILYHANISVIKLSSPTSLLRWILEGQHMMYSLRCISLNRELYAPDSCIVRFHVLHSIGDILAITCRETGKVLIVTQIVIPA